MNDDQLQQATVIPPADDVAVLPAPTTGEEVAGVAADISKNDLGAIATDGAAPMEELAPAMNMPTEIQVPEQLSAMPEPAPVTDAPMAEVPAPDTAPIAPVDGSPQAF